MKKATLFGGAMNDTETPEYKDTVKIGKLLVEKGYSVKNGGYRGMMEAVSKGASEENGFITGYTCKTFGSVKGNKYLSETIVADDLYDRLRFLIEDTDLFIIQRGGIGTLAELFLALDLIRKMKDIKPSVILIGEFWNDIINALSKTILSKKDISLMIIVKDYTEFKNNICHT